MGNWHCYFTKRSILVIVHIDRMMQFQPHDNHRRPEPRPVVPFFIISRKQQVKLARSSARDSAGRPASQLIASAGRPGKLDLARRNHNIQRNQSLLFHICCPRCCCLCGIGLQRSFIGGCGVAVVANLGRRIFYTPIAIL